MERAESQRQLASGERIFHWLSMFEVREKVEKNMRLQRPKTHHGTSTSSWRSAGSMNQRRESA
jgi:hypothetical protein